MDRPVEQVYPTRDAKARAARRIRTAISSFETNSLHTKAQSIRILNNNVRTVLELKKNC